MKHIQCPAEFEDKGTSLFLAGGITGCGDWQSEMVELMKETNLVLLNPRRENFVKNPENDKAQIKWEFDHLNKAEAVMFWFPHETLCPITLFELGKMSAKAKKLFVGVDPAYARKIDVEIQMKLARPEVEIVYSLKDLVSQIRTWEEGK